MANFAITDTIRRFKTASGESVVLIQHSNGEVTYFLGSGQRFEGKSLDAFIGHIAVLYDAWGHPENLEPDFAEFFLAEHNKQTRPGVTR